MKVLKYVIFFLLIIFIGTSLYVAVQPNTFSFSRTREINAPAFIIYNRVNNYKSWSEFASWVEKDSNLDITYSKNTTGDGAYCNWYSKRIGAGRLETVSTMPYQKINQIVEVKKPFRTKLDVVWMFKSNIKKTLVTLSLIGKQNFRTKLYTTFMGSIENNISHDFDRTLYKLDSLLQIKLKNTTFN